MREITMIILHCSDSDYPHHDNIDVIRDWHIERGFSDVGYHYFISKDGITHFGRPLEIAGAHAKGYNAESIGICLHGKYYFTKQQFDELRDLLFELMERFDLGIDDVIGHCNVSGKSCPNFDVGVFKQNFLV